MSENPTTSEILGAIKQARNKQLQRIMFRQHETRLLEINQVINDLLVMYPHQSETAKAVEEHYESLREEQITKLAEIHGLTEKNDG